MPHQVIEESLRPGRLELSRVGWALGISLAIHLAGYGGYKLGDQLHLWEKIKLPSWLQKSDRALKLEEQKKQQAREQEMPLMFVDVNPRIATPDTPKDAKFYSDKNSQAANPDADKVTELPKITGQQTDIVKADDVPRAPLDRLQPAYPPAEREQPPERAKPKTPAPPGDLAMAKPDATLRQDSGTAEQSRPRTIKEALQRQNRNQLPGPKMKQDGGVERLRIDPGFDVKATPLGVYDATFIDTVVQRWYDLCDQISYDGYRSGEVELEFRLHYDGRITDMKVIQQNVGELLSVLCQKAVLDPQPFDKWPADMRRMADKDYRELHWKFYYRLL